MPQKLTYTLTLLAQKFSCTLESDIGLVMATVKLKIISPYMYKINQDEVGKNQNQIR